MKVDLFDFDLPQDRIALRPVSPRDAAKMLVVEGDAPFADRQVRDLPDLLRAGDVLVFNDTRVIPAQLEGERIREGASGAAIGATLHKRLDARRWQAFVRNAKRLREGDTIQFPDGVSVTAEARAEDGSWTLLPDSLDLPRQTDNFEAIRMGRVFLAEYDGAGRMFEPVWQDREQ